MSFRSDEIKANNLRNQAGNKKKLNNTDRKGLSSVWEEFEGARTAFALGYTRTNYDRLKSAGEKLVETQTRLDVWLIHPANVGPGLREDDPRIQN